MIDFWEERILFNAALIWTLGIFVAEIEPAICNNDIWFVTRNEEERISLLGKAKGSWLWQ